MRLPRFTRPRRGCIFALIIVFSLSSFTATPASQGQWGRTSIATANITLVIPARKQPSHLAANGPETLAHICRSPHLAHQSLYRVSLMDQSDSTLAEALANHCGWSVKNTSSQSRTATILVAPL